MAHIHNLAPKILNVLYQHFMDVDPDQFLSIEDILKKAKTKALPTKILATLKYLSYRNYIQNNFENDKVVYQITPDGIDHYENPISSDDSGRSPITMGDGNTLVDNVVGREVTIHRTELSKTVRRRIFDILTQVEEIFQYLKKQNLLNDENEQKFKDWHSVLGKMIHIHDLDESAGQEGVFSEKEDV